VDGVSPQGFTAAGALYCVDLLGEPGDFSLLAEVLLRELRPHEAQAMQRFRAKREVRSGYESKATD
jgi:hypothetical protein